MDIAGENTKILHYLGKLKIGRIKAKLLQSFSKYFTKTTVIIRSTMLNCSPHFPLFIFNSVAPGTIQVDKIAKPFFNLTPINWTSLSPTQLCAWYLSDSVSYLIKTDTDRRTWIRTVMMHLLRLIGVSFWSNGLNKEQKGIVMKQPFILSKGHIMRFLILSSSVILGLATGTWEVPFLVFQSPLL